MSTAQFTVPLIVVIPGQLITASLWNNEFTNLDTNLNPLGIGAYADTDAQMQTSTDPFPSGTSRPTSLGGELERIRYILNLVIGKTYWYQHPSISLETLNTSTPVIPSGTVMPFYQAAAPTGWTGVALSDKFLRVVGVGTTGGSTGGSGLTPSGTVTLAHTHTVASHTHDLANHTHTMGNHTHSTPNHQHQLDYTTGDPSGATLSGSVLSADTNGSALVTSASGANVTHRTHKNQTQNTGSGTSGTPSTNTSDGPSTNTSGTATPATDSQLSNTGFQYADFIVASKN